MIDYPSILFFSLYYQYVSSNWYHQQAAGLLFSVVCLVYCMAMMPESPKYLYMRGKFEDVRQIIT